MTDDLDLPAVQYDKIAPALVKFQTLIKPVPRSASGQTQNRTYEYAEYSAIKEHVRVHMEKCGLAFTARTEIGDAKFFLVGTLLHTSGQRYVSTYPLPMEGATSQQMGSAITYGRRYILTAMLDLAIEGEDDDGAAAPAVRKAAPPSTPKAATPPPRKPAPPARKPAAPPPPDEGQPPATPEPHELTLCNVIRVNGPQRTAQGGRYGLWLEMIEGDDGSGRLPRIWVNTYSESAVGVAQDCMAQRMGAAAKWTEREYEQGGEMKVAYDLEHIEPAN